MTATIPDTSLPGSIMTVAIANARMADDPEFQNLSCILKTPDPDRYWTGPDMGSALSRSEAHIYTVREAIALCARHGYNPILVILEILGPPPPSQPDTKPRILLTMRQAITFLPEIENKRCRLATQSLASTTWIREPAGTGLTGKINEALEMQIKKAIELGYGGYYIDMLDQVEAERLSKLPYRKCAIEKAVGGTLLNSLKLAPSNPVYRGLLLNKVGKLPPDDIQTYEQLKDWVEFNCGYDTPKAVVMPTPITPAGFTVNIDYSQFETGRCDYSVEASGRGQITISNEDLMNAVRGATDLDDVIASIQECVSDVVWDNQPDMEVDVDTYTYSRHECSDTEDQEWVYADTSATRRQRLVEHLHRILPQEDLERLRIAP